MIYFLESNARKSALDFGVVFNVGADSGFAALDGCGLRVMTERGTMLSVKWRLASPNVFLFLPKLSKIKPFKVACGKLTQGFC